MEDAEQRPDTAEEAAETFEQAEEAQGGIWNPNTLFYEGRSPAEEVEEGDERPVLTPIQLAWNQHILDSWQKGPGVGIGQSCVYFLDRGPHRGQPRHAIMSRVGVDEKVESIEVDLGVLTSPKPDGTYSKMWQERYKVPHGFDIGEWCWAWEYNARENHDVRMAAAKAQMEEQQRLVAEQASESEEPPDPEQAVEAMLRMRGHPQGAGEQTDTDAYDAELTGPLPDIEEAS